jgi:hypothetical protein
MKKRRPGSDDLQDKARQMADRLDRMRGWMDEVQADATPNTKTFYTHELISPEHLRALRDILGELQNFNETVVTRPEPPTDDDEWEDEAD